MDSGALAPAVGRELQAEVRGGWATPDLPSAHAVVGGRCGGLHPVTQNTSKVLSGRQPEQRPEESGGSCGG